MTDLGPPTALPGLRNYPAIIIGILLGLANGFIALVGAGGLDDGFQFNPDGYMILGPVLAGLGIHTQVFSQRTVDKLASRAEQRRAVKKR